MSPSCRFRLLYDFVIHYSRNCQSISGRRCALDGFEIRTTSRGSGPARLRPASRAPISRFVRLRRTIVSAIGADDRAAAAGQVIGLITVPTNPSPGRSRSVRVARTRRGRVPHRERRVPRCEALGRSRGGIIVAGIWDDVSTWSRTPSCSASRRGRSVHRPGSSRAAQGAAGGLARRVARHRSSISRAMVSDLALRDLPRVLASVTRDVRSRCARRPFRPLTGTNLAFMAVPRTRSTASRGPGAGPVRACTAPTATTIALAGMCAMRTDGGPGRRSSAARARPYG